MFCWIYMGGDSQNWSELVLVFLKGNIPLTQRGFVLSGASQAEDIHRKLKEE